MRVLSDHSLDSEGRRCRCKRCDYVVAARISYRYEVRLIVLTKWDGDSIPNLRGCDLVTLHPMTPGIKGRGGTREPLRASQARNN